MKLFIRLRVPESGKLSLPEVLPTLNIEYVRSRNAEGGDMEVDAYVDSQHINDAEILLSDQGIILEKF